MARFPAEEDQCWLADFQPREKPKEVTGDEDGHPTEAEESYKSATDDEDPTSEEDVAEKGDAPPNDPTFSASTRHVAQGGCLTRTKSKKQHFNNITARMPHLLRNIDLPVGTSCSRDAKLPRGHVAPAAYACDGVVNF